MERVIYDSHPYAAGGGLTRLPQGRMLIVPGGRDAGIPLSEVLKIVKDEGVSLLNEVILVGGHVKWSRLETPEEAVARSKRFAEKEKKAREGRYNYYLKLKAEFEAPSPEGEAW